MKEKYSLKQFWSLVTIILFTLGCNAQDKQSAGSILKIDPYFIESTDTFSADGPDHIVRDLLQDKNGMFWFASWLGIISYDGKVFTNHILKSGLIHFHVVSVFEDSKGNLWFGTARGGLYLFDGKEFKLFTTNDGLADNTVLCYAEDRSGRIWMGTEQGLSCYDRNAKGSKPFTNYTTAHGLNDNYVGAILCDHSGKLWIGTNKGINLFDGTSFSEFSKDGRSFNKIMALHEDKSGMIWIGTFTGLILFDPQAKSGFYFKDILMPYLTYYFTEDKNGCVFFSQSEVNSRFDGLPNQVLFKYDPNLKSENKFTRITEKDENNDFQIFGKTIDKKGNLWFGTMHGPCRYDGSKFTYFLKK